MAEERVITTGLKFPEGPAFDKNGLLHIVELAGHRVTQIAADGTATVLAETTGSPNGLAFGPDGAMYVCNGGNRWAAEECTGNVAGPGDQPGLIQKLTPGGQFSTLISEIDGQPINSPNDLAFDGHGGFYFTDPIWPGPDGGLASIKPGAALCYSDTDGNAKRILVGFGRNGGIGYCNGIGVTDDGSTLLVNDSVSGWILAYPIRAPGEIGQASDYAFLGEGTVPDGFAIDADGRVISAGHGTGRLHVFPPGGGDKEEEIMLTDKGITNVCFGGPNFSTLYITQSDQGRVATYEWKAPGMKLFPDR